MLTSSDWFLIFISKKKNAVVRVHMVSSTYLPSRAHPSKYTINVLVSSDSMAPWSRMNLSVELVSFNKKTKKHTENSLFCIVWKAISSLLF